MVSVPTFDDRLKHFDGVGPGFDHLRVGLSLAIMLWHSFGLSYGPIWINSLPAPIPAIIATMLPAFFSLSGFLVMGSALRLNNLRVFITFRALRIVPALLTEIFLSALILGPLLTTLSLKLYFSDKDFWQYFGNVIGRVRYFLPGVFTSEEGQRAVNGSLWTVGPEILCYITISLLILASVLKRRDLYLLFAISFAAICAIADIWDAAPIHEILPNRSLILGFLVGNLFYLFREIIPYSRLASLVAIGVSVALILVAQHSSLHFFSYPAAALLAYVTTVVGLTELPRMPFFGTGDYSYGIYIYAFPIQQSVFWYLSPEHRTWWLNYAIALPVTLCFAAFSWHIIEKPALSLRKTLLPDRTKQSEPIGRLASIALASALGLYGFYLVWLFNVLPIQSIGHALKTSILAW